MGNWRTVAIEGSIDPADVAMARDFVNTGQDWSRFHCLSYYGPSICGLGPWVPYDGGRISAVGNLSERDYTPEDVADTLREMAAVAPSLRLKVHCGDDWESTDCIATVTVADGVVTLGPPERLSVGGKDLDEQTQARLAEVLGKRAWLATDSGG